MTLSATLSPQYLIDAVDSRCIRIETPHAGGVMVWRQWGQGAPLVLLHGAHGAWTHFIRNVETLGAHRRVLAANLPGYGDSDPIAGPETGEAYAAALAEGLRRILGAEAPVDVAGFSTGAVVGAYLAIHAPELVRRLVIIDAGGLDTPFEPKPITPLRGLEGEALTAALTSNLLAIMLHSPQSVDAMALHLQATNPRRAKGKAQELVMPDGLLKILPRVKRQIDAVWGENDGPHPDLALHQAVLRRFDPGCEMRAVPGAGHWSMFENAPAFDGALLDLLAQPLRKRL